jgi:flavoprotein
MGFGPVADARILVTGHYHHLLISEATSRTVIQVPSMDGGSAWFTNGTGQASPPGMVSYLVGADCGPRGWSDLVVL